MNSETDNSVENKKKPAWLDKAISLEWLGQTIASLCWIGSVFTYGISSSGDWLQLIAGLSWFLANIASLKKT